jgi:hypothetical protein
MVNQMVPSATVMSGTEGERELGRGLLGTFQAHGRFMSAEKVIRLSAASLAEAVGGGSDKATIDQVVTVARRNPEIFSIEESDDGPIISTTRFGRAPIDQTAVSVHGFAERLMTPLPRLAGQLRGEVIRLDTGWNAPIAGESVAAQLFDVDRPLPAAIIVERPMLPPTRVPGEDDTDAAIDDDVLLPIDVEGDDARDLDRDWERAIAMVQQAAPVEIPLEIPRDTIDSEPEPLAAPSYDDLAAQIIDDEPVELAADDLAVHADIIAVPEPEIVELPVESVVVSEPPAPVAEVRRMPSIAVSDVSGFGDAELAAAIEERLSTDVRIATFSRQWMTEDRVPRLSRGDLRRIKEYIQEQEQPLTDDVLVQDVLGVRPNSPDFDLMRFAINFRLSREHRDFDFVGTNQQRFWSTSTLPQIGTTRRKPNELGTDYRYLLDETPADVVPHSIDSVLHVVTFFEYYHGLLPFDAEIQALLPAAVSAEQRTAMLTFETPQSYTTFLVELRFPTPNRGGFILGLDDFFSENLIPGALIQIQRTDNDGHYRVEFLPATSQTARLLELDERRSQRYVFHDVQYACEVEDSMILTEERFPGLANERPVDEKIRRRPESLVSTIFERVGQKVGPGYSASFDELYASVNVERPFSEKLLRRVLDTDESGAFAKDPDNDNAYSFVPSNS